jgi:pyruvate dehydrogenase phosphatase
MKEFNFHSNLIELGYRNPIPTFNGPYITHTPSVEVIELTKNDKYLVLASDGLWDEIPRKKTPEIVKGKDTDLQSVAGSLFEAAMEHVSKDRGLTRHFISQVSPGPQKRSIHDDITVLVLSLGN